MKIGVDVDDVLTDFAGDFINFLNKKTGKSFKVSDILADDPLSGAYQGLLPEKELDKIFEEFYKTSPYLIMTLIDGSKDAINKLSKKYELHIITARHNKPDTIEWINNNFGNVFKTINFREGRKKSDICKELGLNIMIEDSIKYAEQCANAGIKVLLFDKPWNKELTHKNITRINSWKNISEIMSQN
tara:strand:- start:1080 stop:1640 length:561 start_codon:yes stop_codon:yes gene_type:complete